MQSPSSRIWTRVVVSISNDHKHFTRPVYDDGMVTQLIFHIRVNRSLLGMTYLQPWARNKRRLIFCFVFKSSYSHVMVNKFVSHISSNWFASSRRILSSLSYDWKISIVKHTNTGTHTHGYIFISINFIMVVE